MIVTLVQRYVSIKLGFFGFLASRKSEAQEGRTDGWDSTLNAAP